MFEDSHGDRMKAYESIETNKVFSPLMPVYARINGRTFSRFTRGMTKPFDSRFTRAMKATTEALVERTKATVGYVQSDEISLGWGPVEAENGSIFFNGKAHKMTSVLASMATAYFYRAMLDDAWPSEYLDWAPHFDCRVFQLPTADELVNCFLWREKDATRNAIQVVGQRHFSHSDLQGVSTMHVLRKLEDIGISMRHYPDENCYGTYMRRIRVMRDLTPEEVLGVPEHRRPIGPVLRSAAVHRCFSKLSFPERYDFIFGSVEESVRETTNRFLDRIKEAGPIYDYSE